jgi:very-short-patch-repair endonuclease
VPNDFGSDYYVDVYVPNLKLAIEIDEHGHQYYDPSNETLREKTVRDELGCVFRRYDPDKVNVGAILNDILKLWFETDRATAASPKNRVSPKNS